MSRAKSGGVSVVAEILQKTITTGRALNTTDDKNTIFLNSATPISITVNNDLPDNFEADFLNIGVGQVTFVQGTATLNVPNGTKLDQGLPASVVKREANNDYWLLGSLIV